eukprot:SAG31_NODE_851_length_11519_cov_4.727145_10_plen_56_part_00
MLDNPSCPLREFDDRAARVETACDLAGGAAPNRCSTTCALEFGPFWDDCHDLITR